MREEVPSSDARGNLHHGEDGCAGNAFKPLDARIQRVSEDLKELTTVWYMPTSRRRAAALHSYIGEELKGLEQCPFEDLDQNGKVDYILLKGYLERLDRQLDLDARLDEQASALLPFAGSIVTLCEDRALGAVMHAQAAAQKVHDTLGQVRGVRESVERGEAGRDMPVTDAYRADKTLAAFCTWLEEWHGYYSGYDPLFTWWVAQPFEALLKELRGLGAAIRHRLLGVKAGESGSDIIVGEPIGREGLLAELRGEMVPYTPEEILAIGEQEFAWCEAELRRAAREMGCGDDWRAALKVVRNDYVAPGRQPELVRRLAEEGAAFVQQHDLVTVPAVARDTWMMYMLPPAAQKVNPFFLGGASIQVSYPVAGMGHAAKLMSMRGNNEHFARATVFHELIPGHRLQHYWARRSRAYRRLLFATPFWTEGWALYWELVLWEDARWATTPRGRVGMLFWRLHRAARILFSISFHLGRMGARECVELLVQRAGHERATAEGEVRRSLAGDYSPLYQAGYMLGALQIYRLRQEVVGSGRMGVKEFHDAFLKGNYMPIEMVRALMLDRSPLRWALSRASVGIK
ncbi:hypothetical protein KEM52_002406 [Ascosphaera acerosa]|nr:hypothetical protein KEM52_002406 [Ascosphaera acerosa]